MKQLFGELRWGVLPVPGRVVAVVFFLFLFVFPLLNDTRYALHLLSVTAVLAVFAVSWDLLSGYTGQVNFGHALFFGSGAYATAALHKHLAWEPWITIPLAAVIAAGIGVLSSLPALRLRPPYLSLLTMAFPLIMERVVTSLPSDWLGGKYGMSKVAALPGGPQGQYFITLIVMLAAVLIMWKLTDAGSRYIRTGLLFHAIREDEVAARATGINTVRYKVLAFAIGGLFAGLAGALHAHIFRAATPDLFALLQSFMVIIWVVFGGIVSIYGAVVGVYTLYPLVELLSGTAYYDYRFLMMTGLVVLMLLFMPEGIAVRIRDKIERQCPRCKLTNVGWRRNCRACSAALRYESYD